MNIPLADKSTIADIRLRFDNDVERFSSLETGQVATIDAPQAKSLIAEAAVFATKKICDYTVKSCFMSGVSKQITSLAKLKTGLA